MTENTFYREFEDRYRGSVELIRERLRVYLPFALPCKKTHTKPTALDLGCGRGEWLDVLKEHGFDSIGIDIDANMLKDCQERGLTVKEADALTFLKQCADESYAIISAFHFVEHIEFEDVHVLTREAMRALKPGGLLILETPNPESLLVGTAQFYLDPTHRHPLPAELLAFAVEYNQFARVKTLYLQEPKMTSKITFENILTGVSPDYAIVAQKSADPSLLAAFDAPFAQTYGTRLLTLAQQYDAKISTLQHEWESRSIKVDLQFTKLFQEIQNLKIRLQEHTPTRDDDNDNHTPPRDYNQTKQLDDIQDELLTQVHHLEKELATAKLKNEELFQGRHEWWVSSETLELQLEHVLQSRSWKLLQFIKKLVKIPLHSLKKGKIAAKKITKWLLRHSVASNTFRHFLHQNPLCRYYLHTALAYLGILTLLKKLNSRLNPQSSEMNYSYKLKFQEPSAFLSARANRFYQALQKKSVHDKRIL